jgi:hypothetical protein
MYIPRIHVYRKKKADTHFITSIASATYGFLAHIYTCAYMSSNERPCMFIEFPTTIYIAVSESLKCNRVYIVEAWHRTWHVYTHGVLSLFRVHYDILILKLIF